MKKLIAVLILLSLATPVRAGMIMEYDTMDKASVQKKQLEEDMSREFRKPAQESVQPKAESGSSWWKWTLGLILVGGVAAAAGGGGGGGGGSSTPGESESGSGTITGTW